MSMMKAIRGENSQTCALNPQQMKHTINISARIEAGSKQHTFGQKAHKKKCIM
jgi:hypothetical protein